MFTLIFGPPFKTIKIPLAREELRLIGPEEKPQVPCTRLPVPPQSALPHTAHALFRCHLLCPGFFPENAPENYEGRRTLQTLSAMTGGTHQEYNRNVHVSCSQGARGEGHVSRVQGT